MKLTVLAGIAGMALIGAAQADTIYFSDLEADNGGWAATNDWQHGAGTGFVGGFSSTEPLGGFSGTNVWGTILGGDHSTDMDSSLTQSINVAGFTGLMLDFYEWSDSGGNQFDQAQVFVNGTSVYLSDGDSMDAWRAVSVDLSAFDGAATLDIEFHFHATTVVERTGWYVDDIMVSGVPTPGSVALLGLGGLVATRRRR